MDKLLENPGHVITPKRETSDGTIELLEVPYAPESSEPRPAGSTSEGSLSRPQVRNRKVFISHGKSRRVVDQLKELLIFGDFEPVISVEQETVSKPVPQKVLDDMRACGAGIIHVKPEERLLDQEGNERRIQFRESIPEHT